MLVKTLISKTKTLISKTFTCKIKGDFIEVVYTMLLRHFNSDALHAFKDYSTIDAAFSRAAISRIPGDIYVCYR